MPLRFDFDELDAEPEVTTATVIPIPIESKATTSPNGTARDSRGDLAMVEDLLERCWREVDSAALNVKLADIVRLLEFKNKLRSAADAEKTFWSMIHEMRREELSQFGAVELNPDTASDDATD
ncbi:MAG: hypothetical protein HZB43_12200 [candidate division Zixibacteria bacterium]|nr:hypothetical protein [candidate division Zixibacteria bacterium]